MAEVENKFIVINVKDLKYLTEEYREKLFVITKAIEYGRQDEGKKINDYWVCNQDEPYADQIKSIILTGETKKVIPLEPPVSQENGGQDIKKITHRLILKIENLPMETDSKLGKEHTGYCKAISDVITVLEDFSRFSG